MAVSDQIEDKAGEVNKYVEEFQVYAKELANGLEVEMNLVDVEIKNSTAIVLTELKLKSFTKATTKIDTYSELIPLKLRNLKGNNSAILEFLMLFIKTQDQQKLDDFVIDKLDAVAAGSKTLMDIFIEYFRLFQLYRVTDYNQSIRKFIDDFYLTVMVLVQKNHEISILAHNFYLIYGGEDLNKTGVYFDVRKEQVIEKVLKSWKNTINIPYDPNDYIIFANLQGKVEDVRFKNLLQTHFATEFSLKGSCPGSCKDVERKIPYNDKYCKGSIHNCYDLLDFYQKGTVVYSSHSERIYQRYSIDDTWYGIMEQRFIKQRVKMDEKRIHQSHSSICEQCRCTCDQSSLKTTVRSFYAGKMKPERKGDVITGVRFADLNKTIYLQIQVGQLLPMGLINASTVRWQDPPEDLVRNTIRFSFSTFTFHLDKIHLKRGFLSGFEIYSINKEWRLRIFSKMFKNFAQGTMFDIEQAHTDPDVHNKYCQWNKNVLISKRPGKIATNNDYKICFGTSNQVTDAGQSIVPYFDSTNITFNVKAPLGGLGFFHHTSSSDYAGFIRPFIYSLYLNYTEFFYIEDYE
ncbi:unnamed protein product [Diamesa hyperborea]